MLCEKHNQLALKGLTCRVVLVVVVEVVVVVMKMGENNERTWRLIIDVKSTSVTDRTHTHACVDVYMHRIPLWLYMCERLEALYLKHYNNTQPNLIMRYKTYSIFSATPLHPHTHARTPTHTLSRNLSLPLTYKLKPVSYMLSVYYYRSSTRVVLQNWWPDCCNQVKNKIGF